ncbi:MAG: metalloregulator ArsR/SmtB family transcription factor [Candidatus Obscuribacterales bacterium]|nr:metalloregulator ArsR/SmtB family transcription factor [Candidatus Obscuribacterales bacterium]
MPAKAHTTNLNCKFFRGLGDRSRLSILEALCDGPMTVSELVEKTGLTQPNASNHLACLRECGLVISNSQGRFVWYQLKDGRIASLLQLASEITIDTAEGIDECTRYE